MDVEIPRCDHGIGSVIVSPASPHLIEGVGIEPIAVWPDDRGYFLEVQRIGQGLAADFPKDTTQVSASVAHPGIVKAFHYHLKQSECWTAITGLAQIAFIDLRKSSRTFGHRNTLYIGSGRSWQVRIPPGVAHGYKVVGTEDNVLVSVTSRFYDPSDQICLSYNDKQLNYNWDTQFK